MRGHVVRRVARYAVWVCVVAALSCGGNADGALDPSAYVIEVLSVDAGPKTLQCRGGGTKEVYFNIRMVNTTADTVWIDKVWSSGRVKSSSNAALAGLQVFEFPQLPFKDPPNPLRSHDGDVTFTAVMTTQCVPLGAPQGGGSSVTIDMYLFIRTNTGEYAAPVVTLSQAYQ